MVVEPPRNRRYESPSGDSRNLYKGLDPEEKSVQQPWYKNPLAPIVGILSAGIVFLGAYTLGLSSRVDRLEGYLSALNNKVTVVQSDLDSINSRVDGLSERLEKLKKRESYLEGRLKGFKTEVWKRFHNLKSTVFHEKNNGPKVKVEERAHSYGLVGTPFTTGGKFPCPSSGKGK